MSKLIVPVDYVSDYGPAHQKWRLTLMPVLVKLSDMGYSKAQQAKILNTLGFTTFQGRPFTLDNVRKILTRFYSKHGVFNHAEASTQYTDNTSKGVKNATQPVHSNNRRY